MCFSYHDMSKCLLWKSQIPYNWHPVIYSKVCRNMRFQIPMNHLHSHRCKVAWLIFTYVTWLTESSVCYLFHCGNFWGHNIVHFTLRKWWIVNSVQVIMTEKQFFPKIWYIWLGSARKPNKYESFILLKCLVKCIWVYIAILHNILTFTRPTQKSENHYDGVNT